MIAELNKLPFKFIKPAAGVTGLVTFLITRESFIDIFSQFSPIEFPFTVKALKCGRSFAFINSPITAGTPPARW